LRHHAFTIKEKLNKPNLALTMAADNDPMNGEQEVLQMKQMSKSPLYSEPTACQLLETDYKESKDK